MKFPGLLLVVGLLVSSGCERARALAGRLGKSGPSIPEVAVDPMASRWPNR